MVCEMALVRNSTPTPARDVHGEPRYGVKMCGHGKGFVTTEPKFVYLKSPGLKFMNYFTDLKNPLLKSFGSYKVEWVKW